MILVRKNPDYKDTFVYGELIPFEPEIHNLMAYHRKGDKDILVVANYQRDARTVTLPCQPNQVLLNNYDALRLSGRELNLLSYQVVVLEL